MPASIVWAMQASGLFEARRGGLPRNCRYAPVAALSRAWGRGLRGAGACMRGNAGTRPRVSRDRAYRQMSIRPVGLLLLSVPGPRVANRPPIILKAPWVSPPTTTILMSSGVKIGTSSSGAAFSRLA